MKSRDGYLALGFLIGAGMTFIAVLLVEYLPLGDTAFCDAKETPLTCARNWANAVGLVTAAATVGLLMKQIRATEAGRREDAKWSREIATIETLSTRATVDMVHVALENLQFCRRRFRRWIDLLIATDRPLQQRAMLRNLAQELRMLRRTLNTEAWGRYAEVDGASIEARAFINMLIDDAALTVCGPNAHVLMTDNVLSLDQVIYFENVDLIDSQTFSQVERRIDEFVAQTEEYIAAIEGFSIDAYYRERRSRRILARQQANSLPYG